MSDSPQFGTAQYAPPPPPAPGADGAFPRALVLGLIGAAIGMVLYAGFTILTKIEIGYMALVVGFVVAKGMMMGSKGTGGLQYQITAAVLTYVAISLSEIPIVVYRNKIPLNLLNWREAIRYSLVSPFHTFETSIRNGFLGLLIVLVGMAVAWKLTAEKPRPAA